MQAGQKRPRPAEQGSFAPPKQQGCAICLETVPAELMHVIGSCLHQYCINCLSGYLKEKVTGHVFPITCPEPACQAQLAKPECRLLLQSQDAVKMLDKVRFASQWPGRPVHVGQSLTSSSVEIALATEQ